MTEPNPTQLDKLSGKMFNKGQCEGAKALGYLYELETSNRLCSIGLINVNQVIADGSCAPGGPDYSDIYAVFPDGSMQSGSQVKSVDYPKYIREEYTNATLVVFFVSTSTKMQCDTYIYAQYILYTYHTIHKTNEKIQYLDLTHETL